MTPRDVGRRLAPYAFPLAASLVLGALAVRGILERAGRPALPLDDAFIHLQYARRLAEGHFFSYMPGEGYTTGATSLLWPLALAPLHLLGLRGLSFVWATWLLGTLAHAALAVEAGRLARRLAGRAAGVGATLMCLGFGAFAWFAWSGMETIPFAWMLLRTARVSAAYCEPDPRAPAPGRRHAIEVAAFGLLTPLVRPEGAVASALAVAALASRPSGEGKPRRLVALVPAMGPLVVPLLHLVIAGHAASSTTMVKWLPANPAYDRAGVITFVQSNLRLLWQSVLDGGEWSAVFVPENFLVPTILGVGALVFRAHRERLPWHGAFVLALVLATALPCTYLSFLWNRVRYVWPFYGAHFVLLACLAREIGGLARRFGKTQAPVTPIVLGLFTGALVTKLPWTLSDLATSARAIDHQQVTLGFWARENLPRDARIGVNDTGAIAYVSERRTFDVVGLTTEGESRYWTFGAGSRFEHYEKLSAERRPTHFIVYPQWMACPPVLGEELHRETVVDQSILGGPTMIAHEARWDLLGTGALPRVATPEGALADEIDVSDLESEETHGYARLGASDQDNVAVMAEAPRGEEEDTPPAEIADGGRMRRSLDRFSTNLAQGRAAALVLRVSADTDVELVVRAGGIEVGSARIPAGPWVERVVMIPPDRVWARTELEVTPREGGVFHAFHYWLYQ
ncbi:hypothetical protein [Polyangium spumosum]|uniref:hypothetical protein n=1 Tax=Polyangium spumosum TaxID=889282 RepID=UPI003084469C